MYYKLAFRNIKRSIKDYLVYFLTLVFAVCIFYAFNSIKAQSVLLDLSKEQKSVFDAVNKVMGVFSVFISLILAFLIIYANNYLIKRRKKELGIYLTLGMEKKKVSRILFLETLLIGIISLVIGTCIGVVLSQCMSIFTGKLFKADLTKFKFIFSSGACIKTIFIFLFIYIVVLLFNSITLRKVKVINLLNAAKNNEDTKVKNLKISVVIFLISAVLIGTGYYIVLKAGMAEINNAKLLLSIALGIVGTFLLFMSLSGFVLEVVKSKKKVYLKELNMFLLRQINSKINTTFVSMSFICLMLFVAICTLSSGILISSNINKNLVDLTPHNLTVYSYKDINIDEVLKSNNFDFNKYLKNYHFYKEYTTENIKYKDFYSDVKAECLSSYFVYATNQVTPIIKLSDYNKELEHLHKDKVSLKENEYLVYTDTTDHKDLIEEVLSKNKKININGKSLLPKDNSVADVTFQDQTIKSNLVTIVVNDDLVNGLGVRNSYFNAEANNTKDYTELNAALHKAVESSGNDNIFSVTERDIVASSQGIGAMVAYIGIYLGIIFVITSAAVLAIQQLSETSDNIVRYNLLRKIGVDNKIINKSLFKQIAIYFMLPLVIAIIHSVVGLKISSDIVSTLGGGSSLGNLILISSIFIFIVYGGYFIATYFNAKRTVNNN